MYASKMTRQLVAVLKEDPELMAKRLDGPQLRKVAERLIVEMWQRGYAISAREVGSKRPKEVGDHAEWRTAKLAPKVKKSRQADVEATP